MMRLTWLPCMLLLVSATARSAPVDSTAALELVRANAHPVTLANGGLTGPGAEFLFREARESRFVLVGEDHGFVEVPRFCAALFRGLHPLGYGHIALEMGPHTAKVASRLARSPQPIDAFRAFEADHPWGIPFLFWQEEAEWVVDAVRVAGGGDVVWGLDQEFMESPQILLERLLELARTPAARALADSCRRAAREGNQRLREEGRPTASWMMAVDDATLERLTKMFAPATSEGGRIVASIRESRAVYQPVFRGDGYTNNAERARLNKRHLGEYLAARRAVGSPPPRVLFKFGGSHTMRGRTIAQVYDLGSTAHELAEVEGGRAFGIYVQGVRGTQNKYRPFGSAPADTAALLDPQASDLWFAADLALAMAGDPGWKVVDLRPLRRELARRGAQGLPASIEKIAWSYEAVLLVPEMHAARLLNFR